MKLLSFNVIRVLVALLFVFSIVSNLFAVYVPPVSDAVCGYCERASGHETWCPSYRGGSTSSSSKSSSSGSSYTAEKAMIEATSQAVGAALVGLLFSSHEKSPEQIAREQAEQAAINAENAAKSQEEKILLRDEQFWNSGDYAVQETGLKFRGGRSYGIFNKRNKRWVINPRRKNKMKNKGFAGDTGLIIFRKVKQSDNYWIRKSGNMRLLSCVPVETSTTDPKVEAANNDKLLWMYYGREYDEKEKYWNLNKEHKFFIINANDELEELEPLQTGYRNIVTINKNGKVGIVMFLPDVNVDKNYKYGYYGYEIKVPAEYDTIVVHPNLIEQFKNKTKAEVVYIAKKQDSVSVIGCYGEDLSATLSNYDTVTSLPNLVTGSDIFAVSKNNKIGAVNSTGQVIIPLVYDDATSFYDKANDILPTTSFTLWCKNKVNNYINEKGKYEKETDYQARMNDKEKQKQYVLEKMEKAGVEYVDKFKNKVSLWLSGYDPETEKFTIKERVTVTKTGDAVKNKTVSGHTNAKVTSVTSQVPTWNTIELFVPSKEAEDFENNFNNITEESLKTATYGIINDIIAIDKITFTVPNGKTYTFDSTKK